MFNASQARPEPAAIATDPPLERLSIAHLMVWTLGSAIILALHRWSWQFLPGQAADQVSVREAIALINSLGGGAAVGGLLLMIWRGLRGGPAFPRQAGHWVLVISGAASLFSWGVYAVFFAGGDDYSRSNYVLYRMIAGTAAIALIGVGLARLNEPPRWRVALWLWLLGYAAALALLGTGGPYWFQQGKQPLYIDSALLAAANLPLLIAGLLDLFQPTRRDYLHWTGVGARFGNTCCYLISLAAAFFSSQ